MCTVPVQRVIISDDNFVSDQSSTPVSIHLFDAQSTTDLVSDQSSTPASIHFVDGRPSTLRCVAFGGYPPPNVELFVGRRDVTPDFQFSSNASLSGRRGLRQITYRSERWTYSFMPDANDDQERLKCIATVVALKLYVETVILSIDCEFPTVVALVRNMFLQLLVYVAIRWCSQKFLTGGRL